MVYDNCLSSETNMKDIWRMVSSGMFRRVALLSNDGGYYKSHTA
jgi:hypothetical protein